MKIWDGKDQLILMALTLSYSFMKLRAWPLSRTILQCWNRQFKYDTAILNIWILLYVAFCTIMTISRQKARRRYYALLLFRIISRVLYSAQYHRQHCTLDAFEQSGAQPRWQISGPTGIRTWYLPSLKSQSIRISHRGLATILNISHRVVSFRIFIDRC